MSSLFSLPPLGAPLEEVRRFIIDGLDRLASHTFIIGHDDLATIHAGRDTWLMASDDTLKLFQANLDKYRGRGTEGG